MFGFDDVAMAAEIGAKEVAKKFSKLGTELGKLAVKESDKVSKLLNDGVDKIKYAEYIKPFDGNPETKFPWEKHFPGFMGEEALEKSFMQSEMTKKALRAERHPAKMPSDISKRLVGEGELFSEQLWAYSTASERCVILNEAFKIMAEEACIPQDMIDNAIVRPQDFNDAPGNHTKAAVNLFIDLDKNGEFYVSDNIEIGVNYNDLMNPNYSLNDTLGSLYHEVVHAMQEQSLCEGGNTFTYAEMQKEWKADIKNRIENLRKAESGEVIADDGKFVDYLTESMETWAHMQTDYFTKILDATRIDSVQEYGYGMVANSEIIGAKVGSGEISFGNRSWESRAEDKVKQAKAWDAKLDARTKMFENNPTAHNKSLVESAAKQSEKLHKEAEWYRSKAKK